MELNCIERVCFLLRVCRTVLLSVVLCVVRCCKDHSAQKKEEVKETEEVIEKEEEVEEEMREIQQSTRRRYLWD